MAVLSMTNRNPAVPPPPRLLVYAGTFIKLDRPRGRRVADATCANNAGGAKHLECTRVTTGRRRLSAIAERDKERERERERSYGTNAFRVGR